MMLGGEVAQHENFANIIHDIALLHSLDVKIVLILGTRPQIEQRLSNAGLSSEFYNGIRITDTASIEHVKDAVGSVRTQFEAQLSMGLPNSPMQGSRIRVCSGNFVTAKPYGIHDGIEFHHTGSVRRIDAEAIHQQLNDGSIVLLSTLGYSPTGEVFNLAFEDVAVCCAAALDADKLMLFGGAAGITDGAGKLLRQCKVSEIDDLGVTDPQQLRLLETARQGCDAGVPRCHIISYGEDCALLEELFTHDGSGTLVAHDDFEQYRAAKIDDIGGILELIEPLEQKGILLKRSRELLETEIQQFRLMERDGRIVACAALYPYAEEGCGEVACIVSHPEYRGGKRGLRLLQEIEEEAVGLGLDRVFVLTTQTTHWFIEQGFVEQSRAALPQEKQLLYNLQRNSKVLFKQLAVS